MPSEPDAPEHDVTLLLQHLQAGKSQAEEVLLGRLYDELHGMARRFMAAEREWKRAREWLFEFMTRGETGADPAR